MNAGELIIGCVALLIGVGPIAVNKPYGRSLERWKSRGRSSHQPKTDSVRLLRPTHTGHYPFTSAIGVLAILIGLLAILIGFA